MTAGDPPHRLQGTVGSLLRNIRTRYFVGRETERAAFAEALAPGGREWKILNVYGPGGVGKSTLLDAFQNVAESQCAPTLLLDARDLSGNSEIFLSKLCTSLESHGIEVTPSLGRCVHALRALAAQRPLVLFLDTYEDIGPLDRWLRESFLPQLPQNSVVVIAGRLPLQVLWRRECSAWCQLVQPLPLEAFDLPLARSYLALHGVEDEALAYQTWAFAKGHPLALSLTAILVQREGLAALAEAPQRPEIMGEITRRWLREVPGERLCSLVEAAAVPRRFNEDLLSRLAVLDAGDFHHLTELSFVRRSRHGWALHDLMREEITRELRQRCPERFRQLRLETLTCYADMATQAADEDERRAALEDFFYLLGDGLLRATLFQHGADASTGLHVVSAEPADLPAIKAYLATRDQERAEQRLEMFDQESGARMEYLLRPLPWEASAQLLEIAPGAVRLLLDGQNDIRGMSIVLPVNRATLPYLQTDAITARLFTGAADVHAPENGATTGWVMRLVDMRDPNDQAARACLLRDLFNLLLRQPAVFLACTLSPFYLDLLRYFGFARIPAAPGADDEDAPEMYRLDLRGPQLGAYLRQWLERERGGGSPVVVTDMDSTPEASLLSDVECGKLKGLLTPRELDIAMAALNGRSDKEIGAQLAISPFTVKKHMSRILEKLGIHRRTQLHTRLSQFNDPDT